MLIFDDATGRSMAQAFEEDLGQSLEMHREAPGTTDRWRIASATPWPGA